MKRNITLRALGGALLAILVPVLGIAEVSVQLTRDESFRRVVYLTRSGRSQVVWRQVRPFLPQEVLLNPLGDTLGDLPPVIATNPISGRPWVFWSRNVANIKQVVHATWTDAGWTAPRPVSGETGPIPALPFDELDPAVAFDAAGVPFLVWWRAVPGAGEVYFSTLIGGVFAPPLRLSPEGVDSRRPTIRVEGSRALVTYGTPTGPATTIYETAVLIESAASLMDSPTPPGYKPDSGKGGGDSGGQPGSGDGPFKR